MSVDFFKPLLIEFLDHGEIDIFKRNNVGVRRAEHKRVIPLVFDAIEGRRLISVCPAYDHAWDTHDVELQSRGIQPGNHFSRRDQNLLSLMSANLAARSLVFNVNRANLVFHELLYQVANMML